MEGSLARGKAFTLHWNNGWGEHFNGPVTLVMRSAQGKEPIETYQCDQVHSERALAQADAERLFTQKTVSDESRCCEGRTAAPEHCVYRDCQKRMPVAKAIDHDAG